VTPLLVPLPIITLYAYRHFSRFYINPVKTFPLFDDSPAARLSGDPPAGDLDSHVDEDNDDIFHQPELHEPLGGPKSLNQIAECV
jgi:hypothetical protein